MAIALKSQRIGKITTQQVRTNQVNKAGKVFFIENLSNYLPFGIYDQNSHTNPLCSRPFGDNAI